MATAQHETLLRVSRASWSPLRRCHLAGCGRTCCGGAERRPRAFLDLFPGGEFLFVPGWLCSSDMRIELLTTQSLPEPRCSSSMCSTNFSTSCILICMPFLISPAMYRMVSLSLLLRITPPWQDAMKCRRRVSSFSLSESEMFAVALGCIGIFLSRWFFGKSPNRQKPLAYWLRKQMYSHT